MVNLANRCNSQIGGASENLKPASPQERAALEGAPCSAGHFTFSMWVKKIRFFTLHRSQRANICCLPCLFHLRQRWWLFLASREEEGRPSREVHWASPSPTPSALQPGPPGCYGRARNHFSETGGKIYKSCLKPSVGRNSAPHGTEAVSESKKKK